MGKPNSPAEGAAAVDTYLAQISEPARTILTRLRAIIRAAAPPDATEEIHYQLPAFRYKSPLVGYGAFEKHCSLFVLSPFTLGAFAEELRNYQTSKGTVRFSLDEPLPAALIERIVRARVVENR